MEALGGKKKKSEQNEPKHSRSRGMLTILIPVNLTYLIFINTIL